jgi:hypothetical protein
MDDDKKTRIHLLDDLATRRRELEVLHAARIDAESVIGTVRMQARTTNTPKSL